MLKATNKVGRNDLCPCRSGLKFKYCHGDELKTAVCQRVANLKMIELIRLEQIKRGLIKLPYHCNSCNKGFEEPKHSDIGSCSVCPNCNSTNFVRNERDSNG